MNNDSFREVVYLEKGIAETFKLNTFKNVIVNKVNIYCLLSDNYLSTFVFLPPQLQSLFLPYQIPIFFTQNSFIRIVLTYYF